MPTFAIELYDGSHYIVDVPIHEGHTHPNSELLSQARPRVIELANAVINLDTHEWVKSRYNEYGRVKASQHEVSWFMRGDCKNVTLQELNQIVKILHGNR